MDIFAEIEVAANPPREIVPRAQQITGAADPVRQKFYDMRGLASDNPYTWNEARLFYRQAKFMEDFADDYEPRAEFSMHYPCFQRMGYERLRTYFTWRTAARRGEILPVGLSYIFLYAYELLACVGAENPADALSRLVALREACAGEFPSLNEYLPAWFRDFHVYYELPQDFLEFIAANNLQNFYGGMFVFGENAGLEAWNEISSYDIEKSKFFLSGEENEKILRECFAAVMRGISALCAAKSLCVKDLFVHTGAQEIPWVPFRRALFYPWLRRTDRRVELPGGEIFRCENNNWTTLHAAPYAHKKDLAAFILRKTEAAARDAAGFKAKIAADAASLFKARAALSTIGISASEIEHAIEKSAAEYFAEKNRVVVNVSRKNLARIREEAEDITEKLVVEEEEKEKEKTLGLRPNTPQGDTVPLTRAAWASSGAVIAPRPAPSFLAVTSKDSAVIAPRPAPSFLAVTSKDSAEACFVASLTELEMTALRMIIGGGDFAEIKAFADRAGIMPEILADNINEKAMDTIGDNILEFSDTFEVYDEYKNIFESN